jgi:cytochrome c oxidase subunit 3
MSDHVIAAAKDSSHKEVHTHVHRDDEGSKMGMWLFLFTEILLFAGMFLMYGCYRYYFADDFTKAALELDTFLGTINTIILLTSSMTIAISIHALQKGQKKFCIYLLIFTILCGLAFLVNKYFEWGHKIGHGIYPKGPALADMSDGEVLFFGLYYVMTGLHGLHIIVGLIFITFVLVFIIRGSLNPTNLQKLENAGLYWHLVDLIWIFLFPLFYLIH